MGKDNMDDTYIYKPKEIDTNSQDERGCPTCQGTGVLPLVGTQCKHDALKD